MTNKRPLSERRDPLAPQADSSKASDSTDDNNSLRNTGNPVAIVNTLLKRIKVPLRIQSLRECVPSLFIALFEGLLETRIPDLKRGTNALTDEGRLHNIQLLLKTLEKDVLGVDMGHIPAEDVCKGEERAVLHLVEIFGSLGRA
ncbi:Centrosomal protein of 95 kDa, partial [Chytridiales sp. JEL 0842]